MASVGKLKMELQLKLDPTFEFLPKILHLCGDETKGQTSQDRLAAIRRLATEWANAVVKEVECGKGFEVTEE